jgi:hypothetical protein
VFAAIQPRPLFFFPALPALPLSAASSPISIFTFLSSVLTYPFSFHILAHSFALIKNSTLLFSSVSALRIRPRMRILGEHRESKDSSPLFLSRRFTYPLYTHTLAHSFALNRKSSPLFSEDCALFAKNHPGWGETFNFPL